MANWREKIGLNALIDKFNLEHPGVLDGDPVPEDVKQAFAAEMRKSSSLAVYAGMFLRDDLTVARFNRLLTQVYDTADRNLVWCG